jgi:hypothetical protein
MSLRLRDRFCTYASDEYHTDGVAFLAIKCSATRSIDRELSVAVARPAQQRRRPRRASRTQTSPTSPAEIQQAVVDQTVPPSTWICYRDHHLVHELIETRPISSDRVRAYEAIAVVPPFINQHIVDAA